jgi:hypothetical protein
VEEAKVGLSDLFRPEDYPAPEELCSKFSFETKNLSANVTATSLPHLYPNMA